MIRKSNSQNMGTILLKGPVAFVLGYALVVLSPLILVRLLGIEHKSGQFDLAVGSGMVALMIFLTAFFFSGRFEWLNGKRGLDLMLKFHRRIVLVAVVFTLMHVLLVAPKAMPDLMWPVALAFVLILLIIGSAKARTKTKMKYEAWRLSHGLMAITVVALLSFHALTEGNYSAHPAVATYWIILTVATILSLPYVHIYVPLKAQRYPYKLTSVRNEGSNQWTVEMEPDGFEVLDYHAGQYAFVSFGETPFHDRAHPFSFASCPADRSKIAFTIKETGDFTQNISDLKVGSNSYLYGPYGYLTRDVHRGPTNRSRGLVLLAAGIGITPMISMLREMRANKEQEPVKLYYACRYEEDFLYCDEIHNIVSELNLDLHLILSQPNENWVGETGRISPQYLKDQLSFPHYEEYLYFVCGTSSFVNGTVETLYSIKDIPFFNIRYEDFSVYN